MVLRCGSTDGPAFACTNRLRVPGPLLRNERLERTQTGLRVHTLIPGELEHYSLEESDQQTRHRLRIERSREFSPRLRALYQAGQYRFRAFYAGTNRNGEPPIVQALRP